MIYSLDDQTAPKGKVRCVFGRPTRLIAKIKGLPPSVNALYARNPFGGAPRLSAAGRAFKNQCTDVVRSVLVERAFQPLPQHVAWRVLILVWMKRVETEKWRREGQGERFTTRDVDGFLKVLIDGVYEALGINDKAVFDLRVEKCDGRGDDWVDILLEETTVDEQPNATEIAQIINSRRSGVRASPRDNPLVLRDLFDRAPRPGELRHTVFDAWRWEIMSRLYPVFADVQAHITCPARSARIDACFECTDFMVINCMANAARLRVRRADGSITEEDLLNLEERKQETYLTAVERPPKEETMTENGKSLPQMVGDVLRRLLHAMDGNESELKYAINAIYHLLAERRDETEDKEYGLIAEQQFTKIAVILHDLAQHDFKLPHNVLYYQDMSLDKVPEEIAEDIKQRKGVIPYCTSLYNRVADLYRARAAAAHVGPTAGTGAERSKEEETTPEGPRRRRRKSVKPEISVAAGQQIELPGMNGESAEQPLVQEFARGAPKKEPQEEPSKEKATLDDRLGLLEEKFAKMANNMIILQRNFMKLSEQIRRGP